ncbi:mycothiol synthase [Corynebacterium choanae]|uniref:Mycothiol acetyltransferase n=1 Tax=Corynebacterium choanae TaxID=1862358 RepID=A0A3G6J425_9CORY|nr:mycothiol synthase [Corynebacterium choanae]AZA12825.1 Mycothiol acetyltransferase [Corynebacterium choanae]
MAFRIETYSQPLSDDLQTTLLSVIDEATSVDGIAAISEQFRRAITDGRTDSTAAVTVYGVVDTSEQTQPIVAVAVQRDAQAECVVAPHSRNAGIGSQLLAHLFAAGVVDVWAHGQHPAAVHLAKQLGLSITRELLVLASDNDNAARVVAKQQDTTGLMTLPAQRRFTTYEQACSVADPTAVAAAWVAVNNAAFDWHPEQGGWSQATLQRAMEVDWFDPNSVHLLWDTAAEPGAEIHPPAADANHDPEVVAGLGRLAGFHWVKRHPDGVGEVYVIGIAPHYQGTGLFRPLMAQGLRDLLQGRAGAPAVTKIVLYVEADNTPAVAGYRRLGFTTAETHVVFHRHNDGKDTPGTSGAAEAAGD